MPSQPRSQRREQRPAARRPKLSRDRLAAAALALIDRDGLEACSTRKLGAALGVEAMAIYHHFASRDELLNAIGDRLLEPLQELEATLKGLAARIEADRETGINGLRGVEGKMRERYYQAWRHILREGWAFELIKIHKS